MPPVPPGQIVLAVIQIAWWDGAQSLLDKNKPRLHQPARRKWVGAACFQCVTPSACAIVLVNRNGTAQDRRLAGQKSTQWAIKVSRLLT